MRLSALRRHDLGVRQSAIVKLDRSRLLDDVALCVAAAGALEVFRAAVAAVPLDHGWVSNAQGALARLEAALG